MEAHDDTLFDEGEFDHAIIPASSLDVLMALKAMQLHSGEVFSDITQRMEGFYGGRRIFVSANGPESSIAWIAAGDTDLLKRLSQHFNSTIKWAYVSVGCRSWAYLEYCCGQRIEMILDPRYAWQSGTTSGEVLRGEGERDYDTLADFLAALKERYSPPDEQWSYPAWTTADTRDTFLSSAKACHWSIEVGITKPGYRFAKHGPVPAALWLEMQ